MKKRMIVMLLGVCMLLMMLLFTVYAETTVVDSGECGVNGGNVTWELNSNGTLTISGTGAMADYTWTNFVPTTPWYQYESSIKKIVVEDGVISIGSSAFYSLSYVTSVEISNDVLSIKSYAFSGCYNLPSIDLPDNLQYLAESCFQSCFDLTEVNIPDTVTKLEGSVFYGCSKLEKVSLPSNITLLPGGFFRKCASLESVQIPDSVTELGAHCFNECTKLKSIFLPSGLTTIGWRAFLGCTSLEEVKIPDTVTALELEAFSNCTDLAKLELPKSLKTVPAKLCYGCTSLQTIEIPESVTVIESAAFSNCNSLRSVILPDGLQKLEDTVFYNCPNLSTIVLPESVTAVGTNVFGFYKNIYDENDLVPEAKIYCYAGSAGETYAKNAGVPYSIINISINSADCGYTGDPVTPAVIISIDDQELEYRSDYTVTYENNTNFGKARALITFVNDYSTINGVRKNFRIGNPIDRCEIVLDKEEYQYNMRIPEVTVVAGDQTLVLNEDYEIYYALAGENWRRPAANQYKHLWGLGECTITVVGMNDYIGEKTIVINISKFDIANASLWTRWVSEGNGSSSTSRFSLEHFIYDGTEKTQSGFRVCDPNDTIEPENYVITYKNNINAGKATMTITGTGDYYTGILKKQFTIYASGGNGELYSDVPDASWQFSFVNYAIENNLMAGKGIDAYGRVIFDPNKPISREEFVQVLYNAENKPSVSVANKFPDVDNAAWYKNAVLWANENNIASGTGKGTFGVGQNISRQDLAMMLYKYAKLKGCSLAANAGEINRYADGDKVANYAKTAMDWAVTNGVLSGKGTLGADISTFHLDPAGTATRAECAAMLKNFMTAFNL